MDAIAGDIVEYKIIQSIPGIENKIEATIVTEIGEIDRFNQKPYPSDMAHSTMEGIAPMALASSGMTVF